MRPFLIILLAFTCYNFYAQKSTKHTISGYVSDATSGEAMIGVKIFVSSINKKNIYGVQFHPEKSQSNGLKVIKNFYERC